MGSFLSHSTNETISSTHLLPNSTIPAWFLVVLEYTSWEDRQKLAKLNKLLFSFSRTSEFDRWLCIRLAREHGIYIPVSLPFGETYKSLFKELFPQKDMWKSQETDDESVAATTNSRFKINVFAKFRPLSVEESEENKEDELQITLPLHQRLTMIKLSHKLSSNRQALKVLANEGGWFEKKWEQFNNSKENNHNSNITNENLNIENIRFSKNKINGIKLEKPKDKLTAKGKNNQYTFFNAQLTYSIIVQQVDPGTGRVVIVAPEVGLREFNFDGVFCLKPLKIKFITKLVVV